MSYLLLPPLLDINKVQDIHTPKRLTIHNKYKLAKKYLAKKKNVTVSKILTGINQGFLKILTYSFSFLVNR
jgi:hypothetical protein